MALLNEEQRKVLLDYFSKEMKERVKILFFTQNINCDYCSDTEAILKEISGISDKIELEIKNFVTDKEDVEKYGVDKVPATVFVTADGENTGIKFYGIPSGYEFTSLIETIAMVSKEDSGLSEEAREEIKKIDKKMDIQVFVTPSCPYCPRMVILSHKAAMENKNINSSMVEVIEFPNLGEKYRVMGVPKTIINDTVEFEGAVPENHFLDHIKKAYNIETENKGGKK